jgi:uncharacterized protein
MYFDPFPCYTHTLALAGHPSWREVQTNMRTAEVDILIIPGWSGSGPDHWQTRWERSLKTARRVEQADWHIPDQAAWTLAIKHAISTCERPVILVAHSLGVIAAVHALTDHYPATVRGAFLVALADVEHASTWPLTQGQTLPPTARGFAPIPAQTLPCPSAVIASANDPYCSLDRARTFAKSWGSKLFEAGDVGHINADSGHGPWPDGLMQFGWFMRHLDDTKPTPD